MKDSNGEDMKIKMMYTPTLKVTVVDPSKFQNEKLRCLAEMHMQNHQKQSYFHKCVYSNGTRDEIPLFWVWNKESSIDRYYTFPFIKVKKDTADRYDDMISSGVPCQKNIQVRSTMNKETTNILWLYRLGHTKDGRILSTAKATKGIHGFRPRTTIEKCDTCTRMRIKKSRKVYNRLLREQKLPVLRKAPPPHIVKQQKGNFFQRLHMDFGLMVSKRKDDSEYKRLVVHNGDSCYLAVQCSATDFVCGKTSGTRIAPLEWIHFLLLKYTSWNNKGRTVRIDDGKLYAIEFVELFIKFGHFVDMTGPDNSAANSKVERFHLDVKEGVRCLIFGVLWSYKNWNLAFYHYLHIYNTTSHGEAKKYLLTQYREKSSTIPMRGYSVVESQSLKMERDQL